MTAEVIFVRFAGLADPRCDHRGRARVEPPAPGLKTNALVSLGAAIFVIFGAAVEGTESLSRVGAQVVTGIGFLGGGIMLREGLNIRGLNTAATLWCSAGIGVLAGAGVFAGSVLAAAVCSAATWV
jgi:putative Mg2+ transporter-C (MgtC) family protein